jgi:vancomycin permeability regulator SanA
VRRFWSGRRFWIIAWLAAPLLAAAPFAALLLATDGRRTTLDRADPRPVALVLGAGLRTDGRPGALLARRLDIAAQLYHRGTVDAVLVSGDNRRPGYNEPAAMRDHLLAAGVPGEKIVPDYAGLRTWDSCVRAREVFGVSSAIVVTQNFHLPRAVALCQTAGIDAQGVGDPSMQARRVATVYGYLRELPAAVKAVGDALLRPAPRYLGPAEPGVDEALHAPR